MTAALLAAAGAGISSRAQSTAAGFRITNARVFDGERVRSNADVAVENGIIQAVGGDLAKWRHLPVIDGMGSTLLPGFIDAHVHVREAGELRQALRFGVTTVLDMGAIVEPAVLFALRRTASAAHDMADLRVAGYLAIGRGPNEPPVLTVASTPRVSTIEEAKAFVASRRAEGADHLKIILRGVASTDRGVPNLDAGRVRALVDAAHAGSLVAVAHVETLDDVRLALANGVDVVTHVWRREGPNPEMARQVSSRGVPVMPVLVGPDSFLPENRSALLSDRRFADLVTDAVKEHLGPDRSFPLIPVTAAPVEQRRRNAETQLAAARSLQAAGATFIAGSDASSISPVGFGISFHRELELLGRAGLNPQEALAAATSRATDAFRLRDRGRIAVGLRADLLLVRGDPTSDILATRDIERVWKAGVEVARTVARRQDPTTAPGR